MSFQLNMLFCVFEFAIFGLFLTTSAKIDDEAVVLRSPTNIQVNLEETIYRE